MRNSMRFANSVGEDGQFLRNSRRGFGIHEAIFFCVKGHASAKRGETSGSRNGERLLRV